MKKNIKHDSPLGILSNSNSIYEAVIYLNGQLTDQNPAFKSIWSEDPDQLPYFIQNTINNASNNFTATTQLSSGTLINWQLEKTQNQISIVGLGSQPKIEAPAGVYQLDEKLKAILDHSADSHLFIDLNRKVVAYNRVAQEEFSSYYNQSIEKGRLIDEILPQPNLDIFNREFSKVIQGKKSIIEINRTINGKNCWFSIAYSPVYNDLAQIIGISKTTRDITQLREAEHKLQQQEDILDAIYQSTRESCTFIDNNLKIQYINQKGQELIFEYFGKHASVGDSIIDFILPTYRKAYKNHYENVLSGQILSIEITHKNRWWEFDLFPVFNKDKEIIGIAQNLNNITERKQKELETTRQNEFLKQINWQFSH